MQPRSDTLSVKSPAQRSTSVDRAAGVLSFSRNIIELGSDREESPLVSKFGELRCEFLDVFGPLDDHDASTDGPRRAPRYFMRRPGRACVGTG